MISHDTHAHVRAESPFIDDLPEPKGCLHLSVLGSPIAHGCIKQIDKTEASCMPGVIGIFDASDIPGENQIGTIIEDEALLAEKEVHYTGQPMVFAAAETAALARQAVQRIHVEINEKPALFNPREAAARGDLIAPARTFAMGNVESVWADCHIIAEGQAESGGQEHLYLETQACLAVPEDRGRLKLYASTQSPSAVQRVAARVLGCAMHDVEVDVPRLGGAFGGKEDQATPWAVMAALAAHILKRPVKVVLSRHDDMRMTGKRHPYSSDFKIGIDKDGKILAYQAVYYQNSGAAADLSTAIMERTLFHATNSYFIPHVKVTGFCCRTNLPPFTAFRGFGGPQAMFVMEAALTAAAEKMQIPVWQLQQRNLLKSDDVFPYGMAMQGNAVRRSFSEAMKQFNVKDRHLNLIQKNQQSLWKKRGLAVMPVTFGISFTNTMLNQAGALVHIYTDGSVSISTAAVEMGQGAFTKIRRIAACALGIDESRIRIESTNTSRVANMSPTAASTATDLNGGAVQMACQILADRLKSAAASITGEDAAQVEMIDDVVRIQGEKAIAWDDLIQRAYASRIDLSAHAFYATPDLHFDSKTETGKPFAYHVSGTAVVEACVDVLRGTASIESVEVIHDAGRSLDVLVDRGQAEGAIVQGAGWMMLEELVYRDGTLLSDSLTTYKVPDMHFAPEKIDVAFLEDSEDPGAVMQTKAIGEPPFMYGIGAWFAIRAALQSVRSLPSDRMLAPMSHERILNLLDGAD